MKKNEWTGRVDNVIMFGLIKTVWYNTVYPR